MKCIICKVETEQSITTYSDRYGSDKKPICYNCQCNMLQLITTIDPSIFMRALEAYKNKLFKF